MPRRRTDAERPDILYIPATGPACGAVLAGTAWRFPMSGDAKDDTGDGG
jgi:hypothetical protein